MKILHTSDWHVGKSLRGHSRADEHRNVLKEIVGVAGAEQVDIVLVVGDLFESAAPTPEAQLDVWNALLNLKKTGAEVVVIAGNHDNHAQFEAIRPLMSAVGITMLGEPRSLDDGGVLEVVTRSRERARLALLPFCSQRGIIRAAQLMTQNAAQNTRAYAERLGLIVDALCASFAPDAVNVVVAHCMVAGGKLGGGERDAQTISEYAVDPASFPSSAGYVALGHLHRAQRILGACPMWYSGSPLQLDFGETEDDKCVLIVEATAARRARVRPIPLREGRRLRSVRGSLERLKKLRGTTGDAFLRIYVDEKARVGLSDQVKELFPLAVDVRIDASFQPSDGRVTQVEALRRSTPRELFAEFLTAENIEDPRLERLFANLHDEVTLALAAKR